MSKLKIVIISIFTIALIILTTDVVYQNIKYDKLAKEEEKVTDECIYENNEIENDIDEIKVSETETKVSPNAELVIKKYYNECGHTTEEVREVTNDKMCIRDRVNMYYNTILTLQLLDMKKDI